MIITRNLIQSHLDIKDISDNEIVDALNSLGYEVERCEKYENKNTNIILGKIIYYEKAPKTEKLNLVKVQIKSNKSIDVVCGANNLEINSFVIVAMPGAKLANGSLIKAVKILNYNSNGMICSYSELGYNSNFFDLKKGEIIKVSGKYANDKYLGDQNILNKIGLNDTIFEYDITQNRSYGLSAFEVINELKIVFKKLTNFEKFNFKSTINFKNKIINNISNNLIGLSSIIINIKNNIKIDSKIINLMNFLEIDTKTFESFADYVAIETGQPIILLDADKINNHLTINNNLVCKINNIDLFDIVLCENNKIISLLGVKKFDNFFITDSTKNILAISAQFNQNMMRHQQKKFNSNNISIQRYMRFNTTVNINNALIRLVQILDNFNLLNKYSEINEVKKHLNNPKIITLSLIDINKLIGIELNIKIIENLLSTSGFKLFIDKKNPNILNIQIPEIRYNINTYDDVIEEIIRLYGYNNVISKSYLLNPNYNIKSEQDNVINIINEILTVNKFYETKSFCLVDKEYNKKFNFFNYKNEIKLVNPLNSFHEVMQFSLLNNLINVIKYNANYKQKNLKIFNIENIYIDKDKSNLHLAMAVSGEIINHKISNSSIKNSFFYLKGIFISIIKKMSLNISKFSFKIENLHSFFNPYQSAKIYYLNNLIGYIGLINPKFVFNNLDLIYGLEINLSILLEIPKNNIKYIEKCHNNPIIRDITIVNDKINYDKFVKIIIKDVKNIFDIKYKDYYIDKNKNVCLTISIIFNNNYKQLENKDVNFEWEKILKNVSNNRLKLKI